MYVIYRTYLAFGIRLRKLEAILKLVRLLE